MPKKREGMNKRLGLGVFAVVFALYLGSRPPALVAYRDTGEMTTASRTLGIAHPPSYPLFVLVGKTFDAVPLATGASRLGLVSVLAGAGAVAGLAGIAAAIWGVPGALFAAALMATNPTFWTVATVQEMYALTTLFAVALFGLALRLKDAPSTRSWYAACYFFGLFLGNRTDLLLWAPGLMFLGWPKNWKRVLPTSIGFGLLGLTVYLYLPLRSAQGPWHDWNHPATFENFWGSITRKGYGATLDLLSKNYAMGELFGVNMVVYAKHLWASFGIIGIAAVLWGASLAWKHDRRRAIGTLLLWAASGPLFLFLANMPPNPHALAIVEPHYLLSDIALLFFAAEGAAAVFASFSGAWLPAAALASALLQPVVMGRFPEMARRWDLMLYDFTGNTLRSVPDGSALIAKKDVQLFSLWDAQLVEGRRPGVKLVSQGIAHSAWYRASQKRFDSGLALGTMRSKNDFNRFLSENKMPLFATPDSDIPEGVAPTGIRGIVARISSAPVAGNPSPFLIQRGDYRYEERPEFFTADLVDSLSLSRQRRGAALASKGRYEEAIVELRAAWTMKRRQPEAVTFLGYSYFQLGRLEEARAAYIMASRLYDEMLALTEEYYSLPAVKESIKGRAAHVALNLGACLERLNDKGEAERSYRRALVLNPRFGLAYFNIAVLYWNSNPRRAVAELEAAVRTDPNNAKFRKYLAVARSKLAGTR